jgi:hypothetical protein
MIKASNYPQDLRRRIYVKVKADRLGASSAEASVGSGGVDVGYLTSTSKAAPT